MCLLVSHCEIRNLVACTDKRTEGGNWSIELEARIGGNSFDAWEGRNIWDSSIADGKDEGTQQESLQLGTKGVMNCQRNLKLTLHKVTKCIPYSKP